MAENEKELVNRGADFDAFKAMDALDDEAIIAELEGRIVESWVYHFPQEGKEIWGLSKVGVDMACREMAKLGEAIREEDVLWTIDPTDLRYVLFKASASRIAVSKDGKEIMLDRAFGTKRQCIKVVKKEGISDRDNNFWFEQGSIKALRNARARLISEEVRAKIMTTAQEGGKVRKVTAPQQSTMQSPDNSLKKKLGDALLIYTNGDKSEAANILNELTGRKTLKDLPDSICAEALYKFEKRYLREDVDADTNL